ncbi:hypothetical protein LJ655_06565 [Paraburkholderia sp. MMS20-SJTN17]|uniref:Uncharacterized protein n=1 Tax=Paraburkholderia translucens TaxID=2886945 RepID=A0ABS8KAW4_9BURK|nr:hypothetical protein [Paraburkholderia sp. MMS20-SJTN17]MCC8401562.1 hypothetical protein [Paraburkholderia sp. MMS20-SJTN17]
MDRRTFLVTGAWLSTAAGGAWPWLAQAAARADAARTFAIVDSTLECGASFARYAAQLRLPTFETGDDAGVLWFTALAPLLGASQLPPATPSLIGFTRASDYFVLRHLALRTGRFVEHRHEERDGPHARPAYVAFALTPRCARG